MFGFGKKEKKKELKQYITGAGACVVTKSVLNGETGLKWLFRETDGIGNGWVALGEADTQAYVDDAANYAIVDFNTLANIEPAVLNILHMPTGADLEFKPDPSGGYFVDTVNGKEIREPVKAPIQEAFEQNLKYLNKESYPAEELLRYFHGKGDMRIFCMGEADFPSGEIIIADPLVYLGNDKYTEPLNRKIPAGSYPVELAILDSPVAGLRIAAARLKIRETDICRYEIAMPAGTTAAQYNQPGIFAGFGVDAGMACFCDAAAAKEFGEFSDGWHQQNPGKNQYDDYFAQLFRSSYEAYPDVQREDGDFIEWAVPGYGHRIAMFASGLGDGLYTGYWGLDAGEEVTELIIPFMNPDYFS